MLMDDAINRIKEKFGGAVLKIDRKNDRRVYIDIYPKDITSFTKFIFKDMGLRFNIASAVDDFDAMEILYHFADDKDGYVISVRAIIKEKGDPNIDTITTVTRAAWWIEREMHELFGIGFNGNSDLRRLLLPDDWPQGVYPLRKNFIVPKRDSRKS